MAKDIFVISKKQSEKGYDEEIDNCAWSTIVCHGVKNARARKTVLRCPRGGNKNKRSLLDDDDTEHRGRNRVRQENHPGYTRRV